MTEWIFAIPLGIIALPYLRELLRRPVSKRQPHAPGQFAKLPQGKTHYQWHGPENGPIIVCVHGLSTPACAYDKLIPHLTRSGARVLSYDLYGRGYSDRPKGRQNVDFFVQQLHELLLHQKVDSPVTMIGYSMGATIVPAYATSYPDEVARIALIAPAGMGHDLGRFCGFAAKTGVLGYWLMLMFYPWRLRKDLEQSGPEAADMLTLQMSELRYRGFIRSVLSSLRACLSTDMQPLHRAIGRLHIKSLMIWGQNDTVIPLSGRNLIYQWNLSTHHAVVENVGHDLTYTQPEAVAEIFENWLASMSQTKPK